MLATERERERERERIQSEILRFSFLLFLECDKQPIFLPPLLMASLTLIALFKH